MYPELIFKLQDKYAYCIGSLPLHSTQHIMTDLLVVELYRSKYNDKLCQIVPGHPELTSNKMAQIWNNLKLNNAKSIACFRASVLEWYRKNPKT